MWEVRVTDLFGKFGQALHVLVPSLQAARVAWRVSERYDDFDRIAEAFYASFVLSPAVYDHRFDGLGLGDFRPVGVAGHGGWAAEVVGVPSDGDEALPLVNLDSMEQPFDTAVLGPGRPYRGTPVGHGVPSDAGAGDHAVTLTVDQ